MSIPEKSTPVSAPPVAPNIAPVNIQLINFALENETEQLEVQLRLFADNIAFVKLASIRDMFEKSTDDAPAHNIAPVKFVLFIIVFCNDTALDLLYI